MEILWPAARQYRHNNSDEFVGAYDKEETEKIVTELLAKIERITAADLRAHKVADYWADKYEELARTREGV